VSESTRARLEEADRFHAGTGKVHTTLYRLASNLRGTNVDYAIVGGMALNAHGYRRQTTNVNVLVNADGLNGIRKLLTPTDYRAVPDQFRHAYVDARTDVSIELDVTGRYPGDGKPKPVAFPDPASVATEIDGIRYVSLATLIELKLASGMTNPGRLRDLADVQELIRVLKLPGEYSHRLNPFVRQKFEELQSAVAGTTGDE
jgi:hypothetical protein